MSDKDILSDLSSSCIVKDYNRTFLQKICARILKSGPMPKHVGIIMDGNRRYAKDKGLSGATAGHKAGNDVACKAILMMMDMEIDELTVYSLSSDNLKRSPEEIRAILKMILDGMTKVVSKEGRHEFAERGVKWSLIGNWNKIPSKGIKTMFAKTCIFSRNNKTFRFNMAFAYSSQAEICEGISSIVDGLSKGTIGVDNVNEKLLDDVILLDYEYPVDILIRTGGDRRYSDFLLWQSSTAYLDFIDTPWPLFSNWNLLGSIFRYQHQVLFEGLPRNHIKITGKQSSGNNRIIQFLESVRNEKWDFIKSLTK